MKTLMIHAWIALLKQTAHDFSTDIRRGWVAVVHVICSLRDLHLLPPSSVREADGDVIPANVRQEFHDHLIKTISGHNEPDDEAGFTVPQSILDETFALMDSWSFAVRSDKVGAQV
jgi:hypothetical protein